MTRWSALPSVSGAVLLLVLLLVSQAVATPCTAHVTPQASQPNVVVVVFDDLDVALSEQLPSWKQLASEGMDFTNSFVTSPLCCPSRASMLTGQYAHTHGVYINYPPMGGYHRALDVGLERCTVAVWLQQAGYRTAFFGKYLNGYGYDSDPSAVPPGWDLWAALWGSRDMRDYTFDVDGELERGTAYQTDELAARAIEFIGSSPQPFFALITPYVPHRPWVPAERHATAPVPSGYPEPDRYRMMLSGMELLESIRDASPPNTYIVATSDNGFHFGPDPGKGTPQDADTRVPLFVLGPNITAGANPALVANIDIAPTLADWAGVEAPGAEGLSLVPLLRGEDVSWRTSLTLEVVGWWRATRTVSGTTAE